MITVKLTRGYEALIDPEDIALLGSLWRAEIGGKGKVYAVRGQHREGTFERMHRVICPCDASLDVDHINGNTLDNRRCNLRPLTRSDNLMNVQGLRPNNTSGFRGVSRDRHSFVARYRNRYLGSFRTAEEAWVARLAEEARVGGIRPRD